MGTMQKREADPFVGIDPIDARIDLENKSTNKKYQYFGIDPPKLHCSCRSQRHFCTGHLNGKKCVCQNNSKMVQIM